MKKSTLFLIACLLLITACKKEDQPITNQNHKALLLNEGNYGSNDASLSGLDLEGGIVNNIFATQNGRGLGAVGQDLQQYGSKIYIVTNDSHTVEVTDPNGVSIKQISLNGKGPRYIAFDGGKAYVSCYDHSIVKIDTASLEIEATCPVTGLNPEGLAIQDGKLWVVHGWDNGGAGYTYDSTMSVVNLSTFTEESLITIGLNPSRVQSLNSHEIAIVCIGNYADIPASLTIVNTQTKTTRKINVPVANFDVYNGTIYAYESSYSYETSSYTVNFFKIDANGNSTTILPNLNNTITNPYCISVNPNNGDILISNSPYGSLGDLYCFDQNGNKKWQVEAGYFPSKILYL